MAPKRNFISPAASAALLCVVAAALPLVAAHGHDEPAMPMTMNTSAEHIAPKDKPYPDDWSIGSYYEHPGYSGWMLAHIVLMIVAWMIVLPVAVMISAARSRLAIPVQFAFLAVNGLGIFTSIVYDSNTPDFYPNNSHHKIGWAITWIAVVWILLGFVTFFSNDKRSPASNHAITSQNLAQYQQLNNYGLREDYRFSRDSGQGTESSSATLCSPSRANSADSIQKPESPFEPSDEHHDQDEHDDNAETHGFISNSRVDRFLSSRIPRLSAGRTLTAIKIIYVVLERFQPILGFLAICTGFITWWGIFHPSGLFNGLAHWIKGGLFAWYGLLTLGRWMGAFCDFGWGWNVRPDYPLVSRFASKMPSCEFVESFLFFFYGASNVFLEHLGSWGGAWEAADFEHVAITIMFFGGGLLGMLIESKTARHFLNSNILIKQEESIRYIGPIEAQKEAWTQPKQYTTSLNPMPGLVVILLGLMMSSHSQNSMVSSMVHKQWGMLLMCAGLARGVTYILMYLNPPTSHFPSRPPSEVVAAFCLVAGGLVFMASTRDVVIMLEHSAVDAMFTFTVGMGLTALILAWATILYGIKGWAHRREARRALADGF
ncbi:hypothetical protein MBLNU457_g2702t3 [Dothideomycetes sp. NU457]